MKDSAGVEIHKEYKIDQEDQREQTLLEREEGMKKSEIVLFWMIVLFISITFILSVTIWGYVNLKVDDVVFAVVLFLSLIGYVGVILLYKDYLWTKWNENYHDMN